MSSTSTVAKADAINETQKKHGALTVAVDYSHVKRDFTHYFAMFFWVGWTSFYFFFTLSLPFLWMYAKGVLSVIVGLMIISAAYTINPKKQPKWGKKMARWATKKANEYFHTKILLEDKEALEKCGSAIFGIEPHHVLPLSMVGLHNQGCGFTGHNFGGCLTSVCFSIPFMKHVYTWMEAFSVDKKSIVGMLKKNVSPIICPGGVQEVMYMENDKECVLYLKKRAGFIKLAIQFGRPIVPVFTFGLQQSFSYYVPRGPMVSALAKKLGFLPMIFFGVFGLPLGPPKPSDYVNVIGKPIIITQQMDVPTPEVIKVYQDQYIAELTRIYYTYQDEFGMKGISLRVI